LRILLSTPGQQGPTLDHMGGPATRTWTKLMQSAATLPEAAQIVEGFRARTMTMILVQLALG
jgi:hypothetical protein